jgi:solute carrier family 25 uncoupling protein 8/9
MRSLVAVCVGSPVDVVKSRMMGSTGMYTGFLDCVMKTMANEGPMAFYKVGEWRC